MSPYYQYLLIYMSASLRVFVLVCMAAKSFGNLLQLIVLLSIVLCLKWHARLVQASSHAVTTVHICTTMPGMCVCVLWRVEVEMVLLTLQQME